MANASVDKLKALGLRHGEKAVVALAAALCVTFLFLAANRTTIDLTPEQVDQDAKSAESNINRKQDPEDILKKLAEAGITNPNFEKKVDEQAKNLLVASNYKPSHAWTYPEPGAGLIRDTPELIAPTDLVVYPGRGGALVFELDADGNRIIEPAKTEEEQRPNRLRGKAKAREERRKDEEKKELDRKQKQLTQSIVAGKGAKKDETAQPEVQGSWKETTRGYRWVVITGVLEYKKLRENYVNALKRPEVSYPHFMRLDLERQALQSDGSWSSWELVDAERNNKILYNLPEIEEELTPEAVRFDALVAPLPFLNAGRWQKVHVGSLVPKEKKEIAQQPGMGIGMTDPEMMARESMGTPEMMREDMGSYMAGGGGDVMDFQKSEEETLMVRALDFTVEPDQTYRFRTRIVVYNPNRAREDISPGVDSKADELMGPWSDVTDEVTMPADVTAYALKRTPDRRFEKINFQVTRWNPEDGVMVVKFYDAGPGEIVGDNGSAYVPAFDGTGKKSRRVDFTSHQVVLDAMGGELPMPQIGAMGNRFEVPATALLVRPDGSVVMRNQANDATDEVRKDIDDNYKRELEESTKKRGAGGPAMP